MQASDLLLDEHAADAEVIRSLTKQITKLQGEIHMARIIKSVDGKYYRGHFEELSPEEITQLIAEQQQYLSELEAIAPANNNQASNTPAQPEQPVNPPAENPPAQPEQPINTAGSVAPSVAPGAGDIPQPAPVAPQLDTPLQ